MKKKGFFGRLWQGVKSIAKKLFGDKKLKQAVRIGIDVVECIKNLIECPATPVLTAIIPGGLDDLIVLQLRTWLPKILTELNVVDAALNTNGGDAIVKYAISRLRMVTESERNQAYLDIAAMVTKALSADSPGGAKITYEELKELVNYIYEKEYQTAKP